MLDQRDSTFRNLTIAYITALALVAAIVLSSTGYVAFFTSEQRVDAAAINISGRQRMLSQRIALFAQSYIASGTAKDATALDEAAQTMLLEHEALLNGDENLGLTQPLPDHARPFYFEEPHDLDRRVRAYIENARYLASGTTDGSVEAFALLDSIFVEAEGPLLESLDYAVQHFEDMASQQKTGFARTEFTLAAIQLVLLLAIGLFLFRPMVGRVIQTMTQIFALATTLDHNEKRLSSILGTLADGVVTIDAKGTILSINDAAEDIFGYSTAEITGKPFWVLLPRTERRGRAEMFERLRSSDSAEDAQTSRELTSLRKDGIEFPIEVSFSSLESGGETLFTCVVRDITERKEAERRIKRQAWVMENIADAVIVTRPTGEVVNCNAAAEEMTGYQEDELIGRPVMMLMAEIEETERTAKQTEARNVTDQGGVWRSEFKIRRKDGAVRVLDNTTSSLFDDRGRLIGRVSVNRDITARREIDRMKNEFISVVSHELRTPLTSIMGSLGLLKSGAMGELNGEIASMIDIAHSNSDRLVRLINDILDLEKIEAGRMDFKSDRLDVRALIDAAVRDNTGYAEKNNVEIATGDVAENAAILGDSDKLAQVFANLLSNAIKFSPENGEVELGARRTGSRIRFTVRDHGIGIPLEFHDKIFGKFSQADSSATRSKGGTGLGLSICKSIVEKLGGEIGFDSEEGKGSTFYFELDEADQEASEPRATHSASRALIIEDDPNAATFLQVMLEDMGVDAQVKTEPDEIESMIQSTPLDLITLDLAVADGSGLDVLNRIAASPVNSGTPVIVVSGRNQTEVALNGIAIDVAGWLTKPINVTDLKDRLSCALKIKSTARPRILHVEDDKDIVEVVRTVMAGRADLIAANSLSAARASLETDREAIDLVLLDLALGDGRGEELLPDLKKTDGQCIPVVAFSANDLDRGTATDRVLAVLEKSRTSNEALAASITAALSRRQSAGATTL